MWNISQGFWREQRGTADWPCCRESSLLLKVPVPFSVALKTQRNPFLVVRDKRHINTFILSEVGSGDLMCQCCMGSGACCLLGPSARVQTVLSAISCPWGSALDCSGPGEFSLPVCGAGCRQHWVPAVNWELQQYLLPAGLLG